MKAVLLVLAMLLVAASAEVYFKETFEDTKRWTPSTWKKSDGSAADFKLSSGRFYADAKVNQGLQTPVDSKFYAISSKLSKPIDNTGKDLIIQYTVKFEQEIDCGGGYVKLIPLSSASAMKGFSGETPYSIMFGPDVCGSTKRVHAIINYKGENRQITKELPAKADRLTHLYTFIIHPDNTYAILIDQTEVAAGSIEEDWALLPPKTIPDPSAVKPEDWDERAEIPDETDVKPEGWDDISATIPDPAAQQPEDWDEEEDGAWEAPTINNPEYKGAWVQKTIPNPAFKGVWAAPLIENPEYKPDPTIYNFKNLGFVGFELWQVKAGTILDNILLTDSIKDAEAFAAEVFTPFKASESAALSKFMEAEAAKAKADAPPTPSMTQDDEEDEDEDEDDEEDHDEL
uniref:Calreticulin n=1 Tax=Polytomella parva TaxID=51329 RepID=A0A7S0YGD2_9CHLO|nr:calreticulin (CRT3) [Polytomella parva]|mmetsp:Transcript_25783/g.47064  ORF Transcript_25783/g.47064 Transcript_25783/m.47064 type:complete len:401 (+) Transcript_25783:45-1247(+)|eukprot:CAMPEP_0175039574 /NCGR_PEP_ID=MMETSP0052_2-20121109/676_1 /TAXON_ID=51329 ORGANISM="Polytomella parva, Strain SAG 63-3" /NCGR_SAMPLE_ID=MMETSP0052_2 /ASSEMBLY_ACC=CAM_ASM_000194 /LENGTH=400 /DNA_ID=CAMNT_0016301475 /DNA_START=18 /DNA_END=1220 /DNA_ORIENTATION=+